MTDLGLMATADAPLWVHPLFLMFLLQVSCSRFYSVLTISIWVAAITIANIYVVIEAAIISASLCYFSY